MNCRHVVPIGMGLALLTIVTASSLFYVTRPSPLERAYARIQLGMTIADVEAVLPPTAVDESPWRIGETTTTLDHAGDWDHNLPHRYQNYYVMPCGLALILDENERVLTKTLFIFGEPTLFDRLRKWLGW